MDRDEAEAVAAASTVLCCEVAIVGGGPAGLMAAETLGRLGRRVDLFDAMPSVGRKFLLAGKGGLNLTHSEELDRFVSRYGAARPVLEPWLRAFGPAQLRDWASGLGIETFVGSSGRVFPAEMKAAPLLRRWLQRLRGLGVRVHTRHRLTALADRPPQVALRFDAPGREQQVAADAVLLALGGASWPQLGSDGAWVPMLRQADVAIAALRPANCGFEAAHRGADGRHLPGWSSHFSSRYAGAPLKGVRLHWRQADGAAAAQVGEFVFTTSGVEGSLVYAAAADIRDWIAADGSAQVALDLLPQRDLAAVVRALSRPRGSRSLSTHLQARLGLDALRRALLHECLPRGVFDDAAQLASSIKALPLQLVAARPVAEAISTAGGVCFAALDPQLRLRALPAVSCAGEMLDWEAPTGGYLLTGCLATGVVAAQGIDQRLREAGSGRGV